jgi:glycosyltransferase involved in cell wall biosynthesis
VTEAINTRISIITSTLNAVEQLPYTIRSLQEQTYRGFEWIVVDGNSTDGTQALLTEANDLISRCISEPDRGIYDAWNKGCALARGEWLLFLGAGDELASPQTLADSIKELDAVDPETMLVYGCQTLLSPVKRTPLETLGTPWAALKDQWEIGRPALPPHGATFHHRRLFSGVQPFDLRFPIASDSHFLLGAIQQYAPLFIPIEVTRSPIGGISLRLNTARQVSREIFAINRDLGLVPPWSARIHDALRLFGISLLNFLPREITQSLADSIRQHLGKGRRWSADIQ